MFFILIIAIYYKNKNCIKRIKIVLKEIKVNSLYKKTTNMYLLVVFLCYTFIFIEISRYLHNLKSMFNKGLVKVYQ